MKRSFAIMVRVDERLKQATEQAAMDDQRSVASLIQKLIVDYLTASGYIDGKRQNTANNRQNDNNGANGASDASNASDAGDASDAKRADDVTDDVDIPTPRENETGTTQRSRAFGIEQLDREEQNRVNHRVQSLTTREREILELLVAGNTDDKIAGYLNTNPQNVQESRAVITEKIGADSLPTLIRMIVRRELRHLTALNVNT